MLTYYCTGCRAQYLAAPKRCPRCKGRAFAGVDDDAPTAALVDAPAFAVLAPENLDDDLRAAFESSERFRLAAISGRPVVLEGDDAPATPRDMPEPPERQPYEAPSVRDEPEGWPGHLSDVEKDHD